MGLTSVPFNKKVILNYLEQKISEKNLKKLDILDVGIGWGIIGENIKKNISVPTKLIGIEVWERARTYRWNFYDKVIIDDILNYMNKIKNKFDFILLIDVIEHLKKEDGIRLLKFSINMSKIATIVSTPTTHNPQGSYHGNEHERHVYIWTQKELEKYGGKKLKSQWQPTFTWPPVTRFSVYAFEK